MKKINIIDAIGVEPGVYYLYETLEERKATGLYVEGYEMELSDPNVIGVVATKTGLLQIYNYEKYEILDHKPAWTYGSITGNQDGSITINNLSKRDLAKLRRIYRPELTAKGRKKH